MSVAKPAATLILVRDAPDGVELFMVQRAGSMSFAGGAMVFPGGKVDESDMRLAEDPTLAIGFDTLGRADAYARVAAMRETFEEAGVLLSEGPPVDAETRAAWRSRLTHHQADYADFLRVAGHRLDAARTIPFAHWVPPENLQRRFDTLFYVAVMPDDQVAEHDGHEAIGSRWVAAETALRLGVEGQYALMFPTRRNLERLGLHTTTQALIEAARGTPVRRIQPFVEERDGEPHLCIPEGYGYPITAEPLRGMPRE